MVRLLFLLFLVSPLTSIASPRTVYPLSSSTLNPGAMGVEISALYSQTLSYFDVDGNEVELDEEDDYKLMDYDFSLSYGYRAHIQVGLNAKFRQITSVNSTTENSVSGIESVAAQFKYQFKNNSDYHFAISGEYRYRPYTNEVYLNSSSVPADEIVLGDSGASFLVTAHLDTVISKWTTLEASLGYHTPSNDLSPELPFRLSLVKNYNSWALWGGVKGVFSMGSDEYADAPELKPSNANGETARWNSINRSFTMPFAGIRFLMGKKYRLSLEGGQIMSGASTDKTMEGLVSLSWNTGGVSKEERLENAFKEYTSEATIIKVSPRSKFVKIDKGLVQDVAKGAKVDIYKSDYFGGNILIASGVVYESGPNWAIVRLIKRYKDMPIEKGLTVRVK